MTKNELLEKMSELGACEDATDYVRDHASDDAARIVGECHRGDWLLWLMAKLGRTRRFTRVALRRAKKGQAAGWRRLEVETRELDPGDWVDVHDACIYAKLAAKNPNAELAAQLRGLRRLALEWIAGLPPEV